MNALRPDRRLKIARPSRRSMHPSAPSRVAAHRVPAKTGFTLVEMLVATALVLLMMLMFTQVFQTASKSVTQQKGMAENDQKARMLTILMRGELAARTFKDIKPFRYQGSTGVPILQDRKGYFSISEGNPDSDTDDVIQFTIEVLPTELPLSGKAVLLKDAADSVNADGVTIDLGSTTMTTESIPFADYLASHLNQPEFDDAQIDINNTGSSHAAEVCYFLRNGNLYRRVLLIREPYDTTSAASMIPSDYGSAVTANGSGQFWRDFDFSAFHNGVDGSGNTQGMTFHTTDSLNNNFPAPVGAGIFPISLGIPHLRFGSTLYLNDGRTFHPTGAPREWLYGPDNQAGVTGVDDDSNGTVDDQVEAGVGDDQWIGRYTTQETAHSAFAYPGRNPAGANPMDPATNRALDANGLVSAYSGETYRRGEDIVLSNVHSFDIKVWDDDPNVRDWVDLGHNRRNGSGTAIGYYNRAARRNQTFGNRYDTWHPGLGSTAQPFPPYLPVDLGADGAPGVVGVDDDGDGTADNSTEEGWYGSDDIVRPLRAIQITIRYFDVSSNQLRQLTLVQSVLK